MIRSLESTSRPATPTGRRRSVLEERCRPLRARSGGRCANFAPAGIDPRWSRRWPERTRNLAIGARAPRRSSPSRCSSGSRRLPDSRERREVRATRARAERRFADAIVELKAALKFAPGDSALLDDLGTSYYAARDYEQAVATLSAAAQGQSDDAAAPDRVRRLAAAAAASRRGGADAAARHLHATVRPDAAARARPRLRPEG